MSARTLHLPTSPAAAAPVAAPRKSVPLNELERGQTGRIVRVVMGDAGCRKRFAELGLAEGMKVTVTGHGDTLMVQVAGTRMALACRCAAQIFVIPV